MKNTKIKLLLFVFSLMTVNFLSFINVETSKAQTEENALIMDDSTSYIEQINDNEDSTEEISDDSDLERDDLSDIGFHRYKTAIEYLYQNAIIDGYPDGSFKPDKDVNRAEFVKMLVNSNYDFELEDIGGNCFPDVEEDWFAPYVCFAKEKNIISGYPDGNFRPSQNINFVEAAKIVVLANQLGQDLEETDPWYEAYVDVLIEINNVPPTLLDLDQNVNRAELSEMLWRILEEKTQEDSNLDIMPEIVRGPSDWATNTKDGFSFDHPNWVGYERHGWDYLSDEMKNITGLDTGNYIVVDTYLTHYSVSASGDDDTALNTKVWFSHPLVNSEKMTVNGLPAMMREYRAYPGDVMNGRTVGYDEVILVYTYRNGDRVKVLQFFNAHPPTQDEYIKIYKEIAKTVRAS